MLPDSKCHDAGKMRIEVARHCKTLPCGLALEESTAIVHLDQFLRIRNAMATFAMVRKLLCGELRSIQVIVNNRRPRARW